MMKNRNIQFALEIILNYIATQYSDCNKVVSDVPNTIDIDSEAYQQFLIFVNKVDELLELRFFEVLGESDSVFKYESGSESVHRRIIFNVAKDLDESIHVSGKIVFNLRLPDSTETEANEQTRENNKHRVQESGIARTLNADDTLVEGNFGPIVVRYTASHKNATILDNEFYSCMDTLKCVDNILDSSFKDIGSCNESSHHIE